MPMLTTSIPSLRAVSGGGYLCMRNQQYEEGSQGNWSPSHNHGDAPELRALPTFAAT